MGGWFCGLEKGISLPGAFGRLVLLTVSSDKDKSDGISGTLHIPVEESRFVLPSTRRGAPTTVSVLPRLASGFIISFAIVNSLGLEQKKILQKSIPKAKRERVFEDKGKKRSPERPDKDDREDKRQKVRQFGNFFGQYDDESFDDMMEEFKKEDEMEEEMRRMKRKREVEEINMIGKKESQQTKTKASSSTSEKSGDVLSLDSRNERDKSKSAYIKQAIKVSDTSKETNSQEEQDEEGEEMIESFEESSKEPSEEETKVSGRNNKFVVHKTVYNYKKDSKEANNMVNLVDDNDFGGSNPGITGLDENGDFYVTEDGEVPAVKVNNHKLL